MSEKDKEKLDDEQQSLLEESRKLTRKITALNVERNPLVKQVEDEPGYASQEIEITIFIKPDGVWNKTKAKLFGLKKEIIRKTVGVRIEDLNAEIEGATTEKGDITARLKEIGKILEFYRMRDSGVFDTLVVNSQAPEDLVQQAGDVNYADMRDFDGILDEA